MILDVTFEITLDNDRDTLPSDWTLLLSYLFFPVLVPVSDPADYKAETQSAAATVTSKGECKKSKDASMHASGQSRCYVTEGFDSREQRPFKLK